MLPLCNSAEQGCSTKVSILFLRGFVKDFLLNVKRSTCFNEVLFFLCITPACTEIRAHYPMAGWILSFDEGKYIENCRKNLIQFHFYYTFVHKVGPFKLVPRG